jgi:hypothetical protein
MGSTQPATSIVENSAKVKSFELKFVSDFPQSLNLFGLCVLFQTNVPWKVNRLSREYLLKGKDQYNWPPCTNQFRLPTLSKEIYFFIFYKTRYLNKEVNCTEPSPSVRVPWIKGQSFGIGFFFTKYSDMICADTQYGSSETNTEQYRS